jgi:hypothetical protein
MSNRRWKVTLVMDIAEDSHPRKFVPDAINSSLSESEDLFSYEYELVSDDFELLSDIVDDPAYD